MVSEKFGDRVADILMEGDIALAQATTRTLRGILKRLMRKFGEVKDKRAKKRCAYSTAEMVMIDFVSTLCGAKTLKDKERFWRNDMKDLYWTIFGRRDAPVDSTISNALAKMDPEALEKAKGDIEREALSALQKVLRLEAGGQEHLCMDGKEERGTGRRNGSCGETRNTQILHMHNATTDCCEFSRSIPEKRSEIPVAQKLLAEMKARGRVFSGDALHTQKDTVAKIIEGGGDYVLGTKGNQGGLEAEIDRMFDGPTIERLTGTGSHVHSEEKGHGRIDVRDYYLIAIDERERKRRFPDWAGLRSLLCLVKTTHVVATGKESTAVWYYVCSPRDIATASRVAREHWEIENGLHWNLDTLFQEDRHLTLTNSRAVENQSTINKMCLSVYRHYQSLSGAKGKVSLASIMESVKRDSMKYLKLMLVLLDPISIRRNISRVPS